jgi:hypothetical protein
MEYSFSELSLEECRNFLDELPNVDKESFSAYFNEEEMESQMKSLSNCNGTMLLKTLTLALSTIMHSPEEAGTFLSFDLLSFFLSSFHRYEFCHSSISSCSCMRRSIVCRLLSF